MYLGSTCCLKGMVGNLVPLHQPLSEGCVWEGVGGAIGGGGALEEREQCVFLP